MKNRYRTLTALVILGILFLGSVNNSYAEEQHGLFTAVLQDHVKQGLVDYVAVKEDDRFKQYTDQLANTDPETLATSEEKLAFWINVYNAYTLKIIVDNYPLESISELHTGGLVLGTVLKQTVWHKELVTVNNQLTSLDHVEHKIIRPVFKDPRIHFAIVCAAISCPPLRSEAYEGAQLNAQLDEQAQIFLSERDKNTFDTEKRIATISPIFKWFKNDFARNYADMLVYLSQFLPGNIAGAIKEDPTKWKIKFSYYDWNLNEQ